ncbi:hypothetical protein Tco_0180446 [Tanacetum coccineum]
MRVTIGSAAKDIAGSVWLKIGFGFPGKQEVLELEAANEEQHASQQEALQEKGERAMKFSPATYVAGDTPLNEKSLSYVALDSLSAKPQKATSDVFESKTSSRKSKITLRHTRQLGWISTNPIISGTIPPIPLPFGASSGNPGSPNANRVDMMPANTNHINTTNTTNVSQSVVDENLPQLYDSRRVSHVINVPAFDKEDFTKTQRFTIQASSSKALISNHQFQDSDSDVEEDQRTNNEFMADLNAEYHERALLANQKRFYKRSGRNSGNHQKYYKGKYKGLKAEMVVLTKRIDDMTKGKSEKGKKEKEKSEKGLIGESFDWDDESVSSDDEGSTKIRAFMAITEDES